jgi:hypothetical protein
MAAFAPGVIGAAHAQETENVTVSASRIVRDGFQAPTPTTVLAADDIAAQAQPNLYAAVNQLPSLMGSQGTANNTGGTGGGNNDFSFAMRGLGSTRRSPARWPADCSSNVTGIRMSANCRICCERVMGHGAPPLWGLTPSASSTITDKGSGFGPICRAASRPMAITRTACF